jgi:hypothetical protein
MKMIDETGIVTKLSAKEGAKKHQKSALNRERNNDNFTLFQCPESQGSCKLLFVIIAKLSRQPLTAFRRSSK